MSLDEQTDKPKVAQDAASPGGLAGKRAYAKPTLRQVHLRPDEAVLGNCKTSTVFGPVGSDCEPAMVACSSDGS